MAGAPEGNGTAFLAEEINRFHRFLKLSRQKHIVTLFVYEHIQQVVNRVWGHSTEVSMFESRATASGTPSSDLDVHVGVAVTLSDNLTSSDRKALLVNKLYKVGEPSRDVANRRQIKAIPSLQAPLVRFSTKPEIGQMDKEQAHKKLDIATSFMGLLDYIISHDSQSSMITIRFQHPDVPRPPDRSTVIFIEDPVTGRNAAHAATKWPDIKIKLRRARDHLRTLINDPRPKSSILSAFITITDEEMSHWTRMEKLGSQCERRGAPGIGRADLLRHSALSTEKADKVFFELVQMTLKSQFQIF
ncbi:hypothetical protein CF319_g7446 [Tilletia indica]|nr:hypothetical protein CF319_g7446 [Tilletia indica]